MNDTDFLKLCALSRIDILEEKRKSLVKDLESVLEYVGKIKDLKLNKDTTESFHTTEKNVFREDGEPHLRAVYSEELLKNAPEKEKNNIKVKNIF